MAIKVIHPAPDGGGRGVDLLARFQQEAKAAARCAHSNIVMLYDYGIPGRYSVYGDGVY